MTQMDGFDMDSTQQVLNVQWVWNVEKSIEKHSENFSPNM